MNANKLNRRTFLRMSAIGAAGAALVGCTAPVAPGAGGGAAAPEEDQTLSLWMWNTFAPEADEVLEQGILDWGEANNVTVEISRDADNIMMQKIMPAIEGGTLPDVLFVGGGEALQMTAAGALGSLKDNFAGIGEAHDGWLPGLEEYVTRDGDIQFLPYSIDTPMLQFRQDLIEAAGQEVPEGQWTWDQVRDIALATQEYTEAQGDKKDRLGLWRHTATRWLVY